MRSLCGQNRGSKLATAGLTGLLLCIGVAWAGNWRALQDDSLHDPSNPALNLLQQPREALGVLPPDVVGNKVNWIKALTDGYIKPRSGLLEDKEVRILESKIIMSKTAALPGVLFPHKPHTQWLDCANCHEKMFKSEAGVTPVTMAKILEGEYCGVCHGAVSFPLTECNRCHVVRSNTKSTTAAEE